MQVDPHSDRYKSSNSLVGMDWYEFTDSKGNKSVLWKNGNAKTIDVDGTTYQNIGTTYTSNIGDGVSITYTQNEATSIPTTTMEPEQWVSQFSKSDWNGTPAKKACNKACDAMLKNTGNEPNGEINQIVQQKGDGLAGNATLDAGNAIKAMSTSLEFNKPTKVTVDFRKSSSSADKMGDHFVVVMGKTEQLKDGRVVSTTFQYFDPGTNFVKKRYFS